MMDIKNVMSRFNKRHLPFFFLSVAVIIAGIFLVIKFTEPQQETSSSLSSETKQEDQNTPNSGSATTATSAPAPAAPTEIQQKALNLYEQGLKLYYNRQFSQALDLFNQALALDPNCYQAINGKGATYSFLGRYDEGITLIRHALELKPDFVYGHFNLGLANELAGRWNDAIDAYHSAISLDSKDVWSYYGIASIYGRQGNTDKVIEYLQQAINLQPDVKEVAKEEKDFNPVKNDPRFIALVK
ncbi:tetratricopeptide repeat protein [Desulfitobacterium sp. AusDCA]|uniref:tetratricopeptide repeat protein n=1 Tax=Desulfitobacterium sp. AusDCA TaxID=3240383 RepID=UPI003DA6FC32